MTNFRYIAEITTVLIYEKAHKNYSLSKISFLTKMN